MAPAANFSPFDLRVKDLQEYRAFAFPATLADPQHPHYLSTDHPDRWVSACGYQLFQDWRAALGNEGKPDRHSVSQKVLGKVSENVLRGFLHVMLPLSTIKDNEAFFSLENSEAWVSPVALEALLARPGALKAISRASTPLLPQVTPIKREASEDKLPQPATQAKRSGPQEDDEVIIISSDEDDDEVEIVAFARKLASQTSSGTGTPSRFRSSPSTTGLLTPPRTQTPLLLGSRPSMSRTSSAATFEDLLQDALASQSQPSSGSQSPARKRALSPIISSSTSDGDKRRRTAAPGQKIQITRKVAVEELRTIDSVPDQWAVPRNSAATLVDLSSSQHSMPKKASGQQMTMDAYIRKNSRESWGGSSGSANGDATVVKGLLGEDSVRCRHAVLKCNGVNKCELTPDSVFKDCERYEPEPEEMRALQSSLEAQDRKEANSSVSQLIQAYERAKASKCTKAGCNGGPTLKAAKKRSLAGKFHFIGCSQWKPGDDGETWKHLYIPIPEPVNEDHFIYMWYNDGKLPPGVSSDATECTYVVHPRSGIQHCRK